MNQDESLKQFLSALDNDLRIGNNHLLEDLPTTFTAADFLYFFAQGDAFWPDLQEALQRTVSLAMTECYLSALLHISSGDYTFDENVHHLEHCILYGDLLSGAFAEHLIDCDEKARLQDWLRLLQRINHALLTYSMEGRSTLEKKRFLVTQLVGALAPKDTAAACSAQACALLLCENEKEAAAPAPGGVAWQTNARDLMKAMREQVES